MSPCACSFRIKCMQGTNSHTNESHRSSVIINLLFIQIWLHLRMVGVKFLPLVTDGVVLLAVREGSGALWRKHKEGTQTAAALVLPLILCTVNLIGLCSWPLITNYKEGWQLIAMPAKRALVENITAEYTGGRKTLFLKRKRALIENISAEYGCKEKPIHASWSPWPARLFLFWPNRLNKVRQPFCMLHCL